MFNLIAVSRGTVRKAYMYIHTQIIKKKES